MQIEFKSRHVYFSYAAPFGTFLGLTLVAFACYAAMAVAISGCPATPPTSPQNDAADVQAPDVVAPVQDAAQSIVDAANADIVNASPCSKACANLRALGCPEGAPDAGESCEVVCKHTENGPFNLKPACLEAAKTVAAVRACKTVTCPGAK
jgi:hypothetical protein